MDILIYIILLLGSYSIGYGLVRIGFPLVQKRNFIEKIAFGYIGGIILFGIPFLITSAFNLMDTYYILVCLIVYFILFLILLLKRTFLNETDELTLEEQLEKTKLEELNKKDYKNPVNYADLVKETKNDEPLILKNTAPAHHINFDQGLMVKSRTNEGQVFKEENKNIMNQIRSNTSTLENNASEEQKNSILTKLREYAKEISNSKKSKEQTQEEEEDKENEEELLNMFKDE